MKTLYTGLDDPQLSQPYFDADEWRELPLRHRYVHGGFQGTQARFCLYFPEHAYYQNRFYHFISPFVGDETEAQTQTGMEDKIRFSLSHGAYFIETNHGGIVNGGNDHTLIRCSHTFSKPGTYFPVVRIAANRNPGDPFTQVMNMDRVRVVVE